MSQDDLPASGHEQRPEPELPEVESEFTARLTMSYGDNANPQITLGDEDAAPASVRLRKLESRSAGGTRYVLEGEIGRGGMGAVLKVFDSDLRRTLAMKVILAQGGGEAGAAPAVDPTKLARFIEEAQITGQLNHPGVVPVHELGVDAEGRVYFTMRLVTGRELRAIIELVREEGEGWNLTRALGVLLKVCEAMAFAHAKGVVHRDLKPSNVMVGSYGEVYVVDWGLARVEGREQDARDLRVRTAASVSVAEVETDRKDSRDSDLDSPVVTMDGTVVGTPYYMPPEQADGRVGEVGTRSDVYALGAILYHLLTGRMPYHTPGSHPSPHTVLAAVMQGSPKSVHELAPTVPAELGAICEKAMARTPADRYADMGELAEDLRAFLENRVVRAHRTGALVELKKWVQRNRGLAAASVAAVLLALGGSATIAGVQASNAKRERQLNLELLLEKQTAVSARDAESQARALAERREKEALLARDAEARRADEVLRLSASQDLEDLLAQAVVLWPAHPEQIDAYRDWIARAQALVEDLPLHRTKRAELRGEALPRSEEQRARQREAHPESGQLAQLAASIAAQEAALRQRRDGVAVELPEVDFARYPADASGLNGLAWDMLDPDRAAFGEESLGLVLALRALELANADERHAIGDTVSRGYFALGRDEEALAASRAALESAPEEEREAYAGYLSDLEVWIASAGPDLDSLRAQLAALESRVDERLDWRFPEDREQSRWWHAQLTKLIGELESLELQRTGLLSARGVSAAYGWSVPRRLMRAERLRDGFAAGGEFTLRWDESLPAMRAAYPGLELSVQMGLVPLGADPDSGLWEFWHVLSGAEPVRNGEGRIVLARNSGVVLVLLPGGSFWMGAQTHDPQGRHYEPPGVGDEEPVHEVVLSAFFLSKYELTQEQWERWTGATPSRWTPRTYRGPWGAGPHPVETVDWNACRRVMVEMGLSLPSEARWEYGCRGGTDTPRPFAFEEFARHANIAEQAFDREFTHSVTVEAWDDGQALPAVVGILEPNAFGLHDVLGNVWEWCMDGYDHTFYARSPQRNPMAPYAGAANRVYRGASFNSPAVDARSASRDGSVPSSAGSRVGVRPARVIEP